MNIEKELGYYLCKRNNITDKTKYYIKTVPAKELLVTERSDLLIKYLYVMNKEEKIKNDRIDYLYNEHIKIFTRGSCVEPGNNNKSSIKKYRECFDKLIDDVKLHNFKEDYSYIPVGYNGKRKIILDGAHRVASSIYYDRNVKIIFFPNLKVDYDCSFFKKRHMIYANYQLLEAISNKIFNSSILQKSDLKDEIKRIYEEENHKYPLVINIIDKFYIAIRNIEGIFVKLIRKSKIR